MIWGDLGEAALDVLGTLSLDVALPLLRSQMKQGAGHGGGSAEVTELMQEFAATGVDAVQQSLCVSCSR